MTRNFERLRSITSEKRLSRRWGHMERSNTIWSDMVMESGLGLGMHMRRCVRCVCVCVCVCARVCVYACVVCARVCAGCVCWGGIESGSADLVDS